MFIHTASLSVGSKPFYLGPSYRYFNLVFPQILKRFHFPLNEMFVLSSLNISGPPKPLVFYFAGYTSFLILPPFWFDITQLSHLNILSILRSKRLNINLLSFVMVQVSESFVMTGLITSQCSRIFDDLDSLDFSESCNA